MGAESRGDQGDIGGLHEWQAPLPKDESGVEIDESLPLIDSLKEFLKSNLNLEENQLAPFEENSSDDTTFQINGGFSREQIATSVRSFFERSGFQVGVGKNPNDEGMMRARKGERGGRLELSVTVSAVSGIGKVIISVRELFNEGHGNKPRYYPEYTARGLESGVYQEENELASKEGAEEKAGGADN